MHPPAACTEVRSGRYIKLLLCTTVDPNLSTVDHINAFYPRSTSQALGISPATSQSVCDRSRSTCRLLNILPFDISSVLHNWSVTMPLVPAWMQWYKKPSYTDIKEYSATFQNGKWTSADAFKDTPKRLGLDRILQNQTCKPTYLPIEHGSADRERPTGSPMSLHDFYMYLKFIEYSPENLEFFVWYVAEPAFSK